MVYIFTLLALVHADGCPDLTGKYRCGKDGKYEASIAFRAPNAYTVNGPFDLPAEVVADGAKHEDTVREPEYYQATCHRGRLKIELMTLRDDKEPLSVNLHVTDVYSVRPDGSIMRERKSLATSDLETASKMYCVPQN